MQQIDIDTFLSTNKNIIENKNIDAVNIALSIDDKCEMGRMFIENGKIYSTCKYAIAYAILRILYPSEPIKVYAINYRIGYLCGNILVYYGYNDIHVRGILLDTNTLEGMRTFINQASHRIHCVSVTLNELQEWLEAYHKDTFIEEDDVRIAMEVATSPERLYIDLYKNIYKDDHREQLERVLGMIELYRIGQAFQQLVKL